MIIQLELIRWCSCVLVSWKFSVWVIIFGEKFLLLTMMLLLPLVRRKECIWVALLIGLPFEIGPFIILIIRILPLSNSWLSPLILVPRHTSNFRPLGVLMKCLCFSHYIKRTHFVIWHMSEFGVEQSWTQFIKISFQNVQVDDRFSDWIRYRSFMFPLCLSENGDTLVLVSSQKAILYHLKDNRIEEVVVMK